MVCWAARLSNSRSDQTSIGFEASEHRWETEAPRPARAGSGPSPHPSLFGRHLEQVLLVDLEEAPSLLMREIGGAAPFVELDGWLIPLGHDEVHTAAAARHRSLEGERRPGQAGEGAEERSRGRTGRRAALPQLPTILT